MTEVPATKVVAKRRYRAPREKHPHSHRLREATHGVR